MADIRVPAEVFLMQQNLGELIKRQVDEVPRVEWAELPASDQVTLAQLYTMLGALITQNPSYANLLVETEGCDCIGPCNGVTLSNGKILINRDTTRDTTNE